jgi:hypothetical protein
MLQLAVRVVFDCSVRAFAFFTQAGVSRRAIGLEDAVNLSTQ